MKVKKKLLLNCDLERSAESGLSADALLLLVQLGIVTYYVELAPGNSLATFFPKICVSVSCDVVCLL